MMDEFKLQIINNDEDLKNKFENCCFLVNEIKELQNEVKELKNEMNDKIKSKTITFNYEERLRIQRMITTKIDLIQKEKRDSINVLKSYYTNIVKLGLYVKENDPNISTEEFVLEEMF